MNKKRFSRSLLCTASLLTNAVSGNLTDEIYTHKTYFLSSQNNDSFSISDEVEQSIVNKNKSINRSPLFVTRTLKNPAATNEVLEKIGTEEITIKTQDGKELLCSYINRNKDKIVIVGPGFTNAKEKMAPFIEIFSDYDVLLMNFRGHGLRKGWSFSPVYHLLKVNTETRLGAEEEKDVFATVNHVKTHLGKNYKKVYGLGLCFGALIFAKSQGIAEKENRPLFDKIILDGCWHSLNGFRDKLKSNINLLCDPQKGRGSNTARRIVSNDLVSGIIQGIVERGVGVKMSDLSLVDYTVYIKETPTLFFYGKDDLTVSRNEFEAIWNSIPSTKKFAFITSNEHVWNHLKQKELYKAACKTFLESNGYSQTLKAIKELN